MRWFMAGLTRRPRMPAEPVGTLAIDRYLRPVCFQNYPDAFLPSALQNANPLGLMRLVNGQLSRDSLG